MLFCGERKIGMIWSLCLIFSISNSILVLASHARQLCRPDQRDALWEFKSEFYVRRFSNTHREYTSARTEEWVKNTDCCSWMGISCDPKTGNVVELALADSYLNGPLRSNSSLFKLQHLENLDLAWNNLSGILPDSIGKLKYLRDLSLDDCYLYGKIPSSLGNLSYLTELNLCRNDLTGKLPDLMSNLSRLTDLELQDNKLSGNLPPSLLILSHLTNINLHSNKFEGMLPSNMSSLSKLEYFVLGNNSFSGFIPSSLFMIPSLICLDLGMNDFSGPLEIGNVSKFVSLETLDLSFYNIGRGIVDLSFFSHLMSLDYLDLSGNNLKMSSTLHLPSSITSLALLSCNISEFPRFLETQTSLEYLDLSANQIKGQVPEWLWRLPALKYVNISQNAMSGFEGSADVIQRSAIYMLDISSNAFHDPFPLLPSDMNIFIGSNNRFSGEIPRKICEAVGLFTPDLSNNNFSASIPRCFENLHLLSVLHLQSNSLSGDFPEQSISFHLISLDVGHNQLSGELPKSLINCSYLQFLNVEDNKFNDMFPFWLRLLPGLQILILRSNEFHGPISSPEESLSFPKMRIFDISKNRFSGVLPSDYFAGWSAMSSPVVYFEGQGRSFISYQRMSFKRLSSYHNSVGLTNKGLDMELIGSGFTIYKTFDISGNRLQGSIPNSIGLLKELIVLNMSNNAFTGRIPPSLLNLTKLESLDLSQNRLFGEIPPALGKLTFLARMNFSHNMLDGPIPQGTQIQSQDSSSFADNPMLCGVPLQKTCGGKEEARKQEQDEEKEEKDQVFNWTAAAIGYVPGVLCGFTIGFILTPYA